MEGRYGPVASRMKQIHLLKRLLFQREAAHLPAYPGQLPILECIDRNPGCSQAELAEKLMITSASVALSTKRMEKAGLLVKRVDAGNLRVKQLRLTEKGEELAADYRELFRKIDDRMFSGMSDAEIAEFTRLLDRLLMNLKKNIKSEALAWIPCRETPQDEGEKETGL